MAKGRTRYASCVNLGHWPSICVSSFLRDFFLLSISRGNVKFFFERSVKNSVRDDRKEIRKKYESVNDGRTESEK